MRLLLDANLSPETADFLRRRFSFDAESLMEKGLNDLPDEDVVGWQKKMTESLSR